ncbi:formylmethanofuran dehydrogenase [Aquabacter spiritensis]|uniref:Formylmethanofuran dehydrogenase subunit B n=1 Tax=Aquabacter spiritensis TaxID=933073 RepID=A0A4R3LL31_9HYPH|nr:formylmethanofuran dehydrogenase [Aquabacter spiritensis]TCT00983.1 formylmethanofuran dehydrogenase subunit B [Aquabacter spiritensis]
MTEPAAIDDTTEGAAGAATRRLTDLACGFCGLGCDDLEVAVTGRAVRPRTACPEAAVLLRRGPGPPPGPRVEGREVPLAQAVSAAARHLAASRAAVFSGLGTDVDGLRGLADLAVRFGASLDHAGSEGLFRNLDTLQRTGWIAATLAELRTRCDVLVVIGADPRRAYGRFFERAVPPEALFTDDRTMVFLGSGPEAATRDQLAGHRLIEVPVVPGFLGEALAGLEAFLRGRGAAEFAGALDGALGADLAELAELLRAARYAVFVWDAADLPAPQAEEVVHRAAAIVAQLNRAGRAAVFPLGGRDNVVGANQVMLWRFGHPLRTLVDGRASRHAPDLYATAVALRDADLLLHADSFRPRPPPAFSAGPVIALAHPATEFAREPEVFIPVGTPGVDHAGTVFRMDGIVCLPLEKLRDAGLPRLADVAAAIRAEDGA